MKKWLMTAALSALTFSACAQESPHAETVHTGFQSPTAIVSDAGALYVSDWSANQIVRIAANRSRHVVQTPPPRLPGWRWTRQASCMPPPMRITISCGLTGMAATDALPKAWRRRRALPLPVAANS